MWLGKIAIIMYIFSMALMFSGYVLDDALALSLFESFTYDALDDLANKNTIDEDISVDLIFGDFIAAVKVVFGILTGDTISGALSELPGFDETWHLLVRLVFTLSSAFLWAYVVAGRSL